MSEIKCCPTCGHPVVDAMSSTDLTPVQQTIFTCVYKSGVMGVTNQRIIEAVYAGTSTFPSDPASTIRVHIAGLNKRLVKHGIAVRGAMGGDRRYRVINVV